MRSEAQVRFAINGCKQAVETLGCLLQYPSCISGLGCNQMFRLLCGVGQTQHFSAAT